MKVRNYILLTGAVATIPISYGLAIKTNDRNLISDNTGFDFFQTVVTMSDTSTSSVISNSTAGLWVTPYTAENLPLATVLPGSILRAKSGFVVVNKIV